MVLVGLVSGQTPGELQINFIYRCKLLKAARVEKQKWSVIYAVQVERENQMD